MVSKKIVRQLIEKYKKAWVEQNPADIVKIFAKNGIYHEKVLEKPFVGHAQIKKYWKDKVVGEQKNIRFRLLNLFVDGNVAIAEWEARFYDKKRKTNIHMKEIAILKIRNNKISSLREYWSSEQY